MSSDQELEERRICGTCIGEVFLVNLIDTTGKAETCDYCEVDAATITMGELADWTGQAIDEHFYRTSDQPDAWEEMLLRDKESTYEWEREGQPILDLLQEILVTSTEVAEDVRQILNDRDGYLDPHDDWSESSFVESAHYEANGPNSDYWLNNWNKLTRSLQSEARFFNRAAIKHLREIFAGVASYRVNDRNRLIIDAGPGTDYQAFFRGRVFQSQTELLTAMKRPDLELGPPPENAARAGRMNARGISVFYGATDVGTVLSEVRPPVGSQVLTGRFDIIRPIRLLDLNALNAVTVDGSIFDPEYAKRRGWAQFLSTFRSLMVQPVMPDTEHSDYLATQAVADFLASSDEIHIDGILFPSVQNGVDVQGLNVVLFHKASTVETLPIPEGTHIEARAGLHSEEGWEVDYSVIEFRPISGSRPIYASPRGWPKLASVEGHPSPDISKPKSGRAETLRVCCESLQVHQIQAVRIVHEAHSVSRHILSDDASGSSSNDF